LRGGTGFGSASFAGLWLVCCLVSCRRLALDKGSNKNICGF
jgi:hypothetical protein